MLTDCLFALHKHKTLLSNTDMIINKITALLQKEDLVSYAISNLVNKRPSFVSLDFVIKQLTKNPNKPWLTMH